MNTQQSRSCLCVTQFAGLLCTKMIHVIFLARVCLQQYCWHPEIGYATYFMHRKELPHLPMKYEIEELCVFLHICNVYFVQLWILFLFDDYGASCLLGSKLCMQPWDIYF